MKLTRKRWIGLGIGITIFLVAFGIALAATLIQVSQVKPANLKVTSSVVLSGNNMALWRDVNKSQPVTGDPAIEFTKAQTRPPLRQIFAVSDVTLYLENKSLYPGIPIDPCHNTQRSGDNVNIGFVHARLFDLNGNYRGDTCDSTEFRRERGWKLAPGALWKMEPHPHFNNNATSGDNPFNLVFGFVGTSGDGGSSPISSQTAVEIQ